MTDELTNAPVPPKRKHRARTVALVGAGLAAGAIGATAIGANAESSSAPSTRSTPSTSATAPGAPGGSARTPSGSAPARNGPGHGAPGGHGGAAPVRSDEKSVNASVAATLKAAALKAVPGGTVFRIETDAGDGVYEAHMTKSDGTLVTVKFDKALKVIKVEAGMGTGDPAPSAQPDNGH
jgi:hypothetical protein